MRDSGANDSSVAKSLNHCTKRQTKSFRDCVLSGGIRERAPWAAAPAVPAASRYTFACCVTKEIDVNERGEANCNSSCQSFIAFHVPTCTPVQKI